MSLVRNPRITRARTLAASSYTATGRRSVAGKILQPRSGTAIGVLADQFQKDIYLNRDGWDVFHAYLLDNFGVTPGRKTLELKYCYNRLCKLLGDRPFTDENVQAVIPEMMEAYTPSTVKSTLTLLRKLERFYGLNQTAYISRSSKKEVATIQDTAIAIILPRVTPEGIYDITPSVWPDLYNYLIYDRKFKPSPKNKQALKSRFSVLCKYLDGRPFNRMTYSAMVAKMKQEGFGNSYLNAILTMAKNIDRYFGTNFVMDYTYFPKGSKQMLDTLTPDEITRLAEVYLPYGRVEREINNRTKALIYLLATTGCRIGEALNLTWEDLYGDPKAVMFKDTKNGDSRLVPVSEFAYDQLIALPRLSKYVFGTYNGGRFDEADFKNHLNARADEAGINKRVFPHLFRHSFITEMIRAGVSVIHIARIVGHKDLATTNLYTQLVIDDLTDAIYSHPLLKKALTFEMLKKKLKCTVTQSVDTTAYTTEVSDSQNELRITIRKNL